MTPTAIALTFFVSAVVSRRVQYVESAYLNDSPTEDAKVSLLKMFLLAPHPAAGAQRVRTTLGRTPSTRMSSPAVDEIIEKLRTLSLLEASELVSQIEEVFNVDASAPAGGMMMAAPVAGGGGAADEAEEQT